MEDESLGFSDLLVTLVKAGHTFRNYVSDMLTNRFPKPEENPEAHVSSGFLSFLGQQPVFELF